MRRVLITGGAGFLGSHLATSLRESGVAVRIFDRLEPPGWARAPGVEYAQGDIRDSVALAPALSRVDIVVHAAFASARADPEVIRSVNIGGTMEVCRQAREQGATRLVLISSTIAGAAPRAHPVFRQGFRRAGLNSLDSYRESRAEAERIVLSSESPKLQPAVVRPKTFIGPGRLSAFTIVFDWIRRGRPVLLLGSGRCRYQLLEIGDMAQGIRLLCESQAGGIFFFGAEEFGTLREDLQALVEYAGSLSRLRAIPSGLARAGLRAMELAGFVPPSELHYMSASDRDSIVDISRAQRELGWRPRFSNSQALRRAYDWYKESAASPGGAPSIHPLPASHRMLKWLLETVLR